VTSDFIHRPAGAFPEGPPQAPRQILAELLTGVTLPPALADSVTLTGQDPVLPSSFAVGAVAQASIAAVAAAAADLWTLRGGTAQAIAVDMLQAALEFRSERYFTVDGAPPGPVWDPIAGPYRCGDGRWIRIHTNFPHHRDGILTLLDCAHDRKAVQAALDGWQAAAFEEAVAERGLVATMMRSPDEWRAAPQGQALADQPLIALERIGEAPPQPFSPAARPLGGVRVLDLRPPRSGTRCSQSAPRRGGSG
jgi:crotonobetainyl-CoA:carnitine CoA-transferase CaiB-like acyl-CoA transferase